MARWQGTTTERGYGSPHQKERARWQPVIAAGQAWCAETACLEPTRWIAPGSPWHLAHGTGQDGYRGPAHERCNIAEANRRRAGRRRKPARRRRAPSAAAGKVPAAARISEPPRTSRRW
jgi:hypothetical protein